MKKDCVIFGAGTYGQVYTEYLKEEYNVIGFIDDNSTLIGEFINGIEVLGNFEFLLENIDNKTCVFVPVGNNAVRVTLLSKLNDRGFCTPSYVHPTVNFHQNVILGKAVYILSATNIMPFAKIEDFVMISMGVQIAHHTLLKKGCFLSQGSNIGASIVIGELAFLGIGSIIMTGVENVGSGSTVGAGAMVIKDVADNTVVVGNPAKTIKYSV